MSISQNKIEANRRNAQLSTGPREKWGQTSLSQNAQAVILPGRLLVDRAVCPHF